MLCYVMLDVVLAKYPDKSHNFTNFIFMTSSLQNSIGRLFQELHLFWRLVFTGTTEKKFDNKTLKTITLSQNKTADDLQIRLYFIIIKTKAFLVLARPL